MVKLVSEEDCGEDDCDSNNYELDVGRCKEVAAADLVVVGIESIEVVDKKDDNMNEMHNFSAGILGGVGERLVCKDVGDEESANKEKYDSTVFPLVE